MRLYVEMICAMKLCNSQMYQEQGRFVRDNTKYCSLSIAGDDSAILFDYGTGEIIDVFLL